MKTKQTILVVDDDPSILLGVKAKIKRHGYRVITAKDGNEGIEQIKEHKPDLVLSDVMMPFLDGFEMRKIIRQYAAFASIPFIFLTARTEIEDRLRGFEEGADDYIVKPFDTKELLARIDAVLQRVNFEQARGRKEMKAQAEKEMEELKHEILQNFHHELRTPLTNILLPLELATSEKLDDPEEKLRFIRMALSNASRLESLTTDLILLSNIDQGNLNSIRQSLDINIHLLNPIRKRLERYGEKELEFISEILSPDEIFAPRQEFTHSILHLLDNAFKFSPKNGKVKLIIKVLEKGIGISVQDDGPGIPPELSEKVFERFYQISQGDTRANEGLGVGLTIARAVFEANGGYLKIIDNKHGCCVQAVYPN
ncbi:MAG: response regulator [Anaerolineae bacterium]|jgi:signal transduction histidine kinase|nr:response regulator [Anaerolineae bacterium]MBT4310159.1 response regulator [Anaerolineae bacterium]MBT4457431.1 response regulator [Anaerolineae bacterium]MBT6062556.1 response regulator [Anaerolineae bacterium]MBT6323838.1 response regulator [Anaerolineae bacterium]